jgi:hypothetical protein
MAFQISHLNHLAPFRIAQENLMLRLHTGVGGDGG